MNNQQHNNSPTILQILPRLDQGGVERGTVQIDNAIVAAGWNSIVVSENGRLVSQLKGKHIELPVASKNPITILLNARKLRKIIVDENVDIVHARSRAPAWSAKIAAQKTAAHFMTTFHGTHSISGALKRKYNSVMVSGEVVIAVSEFIKQHIIENYGVNAEKITLIHRGVNLDEFNPSVEPIGLGVGFGAAEGKKLVIMPGRITRIKGQKVFAEAMRGVDAIGVIVGDSGNAEYMRELEQVLPDNVVIMPGTSELAPVLINADLVVVASTRAEAFGRISIEAQALGKPVVATAIGGSLETVIDGKTGVLVAPHDVVAMRAGIEKVLTSKQNWKDTCVENAGKFSQAIMCEKTLEVYKQVLRR
jgi:glycosyltransferase involved in cell wall biosynthesis